MRHTTCIVLVAPFGALLRMSIMYACMDTSHFRAPANKKCTEVKNGGGFTELKNNTITQEFQLVCIQL